MCYVALICFFIILIILFIQNAHDPRVFRLFCSDFFACRDYLLNNTTTKMHSKAVYGSFLKSGFASLV